MEYVIVTVLILSYIFGDNTGYSLSSSFGSHFIYQFSHASWLHLLLNSYAIFSLVRILKQVVSKYFLLISSYYISSLASFWAVYEKPTVGASGIAYYLLGVFIGELIAKKISFREQQYQVIFYSGVVLGLLISFFSENSNTLLHFLCLISGLVVHSSSRYWR